VANKKQMLLRLSEKCFRKIDRQARDVDMTRTELIEWMASRWDTLYEQLINNKIANFKKKHDPDSR
jgi:hypothetical protein